VRARLLRIYRDLVRRFGHQHWWPGRSPFEIALGAILTQHTAWSQAARAVAALRARRLLAPRALASAPDGVLHEAIRPAGTYRLKARRLRDFTTWLLARFDGRFEGMRRAPLGPLRRELLGVPGLGPETVDAILLYAGGRPVFVADAYARRVLARHRLLSPRADYESARAFVEAHLPSDPALFNELHALLVTVGKTYCRPAPLCAECPLYRDLAGRLPRRDARVRPLTPRSRGADQPDGRRRRERPGRVRARPSP
jgi:endonuclease-3 related protein